MAFKQKWRGNYKRLRETYKTYPQNRNRLKDMGSKLMVTRGDGGVWGGEINWELETDINTLLYME